MKYLHLKGAAFVALVGLYSIVEGISSSTASTPIPDYSHYAFIADKQPVRVPTSDVVPLPVCRFQYVNLSPDDAYPIPHWVYALPPEADKALVLAIAKNESRFQINARSHRGAVGLMQLMPRTANYMLQKHGREGVHLASLTSSVSTVTHTPQTPFDFDDPYTSLAVGHRYIEHLQNKQFIGDNLVYTLAAYNAGPAKLRTWQRRFGKISEKRFIARIPYRETRHYVRKVLKDYARYRTLVPDMQDTVWIEGEQC